MKIHWSMAVVAVCGLALLSLHCDQQQADTRAADEAAIREADVAWSRVAEAKDAEGHNAYFLEDAVVLAPNEPMVVGKAAIRKMVGDMFAMPGFSVKWQPTKVEVARSGDLGYSIGTTEFSMNDAKGMPITDRGKYATVWKKQTDGSWKVAVDMFNSDSPLPEPPTK